MTLQQKKVAHQHLVEAHALLHGPPVSDEEKARIAAELAKPRQSQQPELDLPLMERGPCR